MTDQSLEQRAREWLTEHGVSTIFGYVPKDWTDSLAALLADVQREAFERADRRVYEEGYRDGVARREHQIEVLTAERDGYREHYNKILEMKVEEMLLRMPEPIIIEKPPARALSDAPATPPAPRMGENTTDISSKLNSTIPLGCETTILICPVCKRQAEAGEYVGISGCSKCNPWKFSSATPPTGKNK